MVHCLHSKVKNTENGLLIESLVSRVKKNSVKEVILATSASIEGETTAHYIADSLKDTKVKITRLAKGVPRWWRNRIFR